ncbi:MAG: DUF3800 domain-containing protein [Hyphomonadaceae bacterium]|nr:DUF3800 domain-containing protein [Hyphomonadaceae bacterium]
MTDHFIIFCDESAEKGEFYSHFYGGALVRAGDRQAIEEEIAAKKAALNLNGEIKWTKITENYADKYVEFVEFFFELVKAGRIKVRIMFRQNLNVRPAFEEDLVENEYFVLYYQFLKHAFGLRHWKGESNNARVSVYIDDPPQGADKFDAFRKYIASLSQFPVFRDARIVIPFEEIAKINSKQHGILQAVDIVLGAMNSRLNELHTKPVPPKRRRGKRARAKERVYAKIKDKIWEIYPNFNVGASTGRANGPTDAWDHPYRHWCFVSAGSVIDRAKGKNKKKKRK